MKVLIVDDDPKFRRLVSRGLAENQIRSQVAADSAEARAVLAEEGTGSFDLILLDVMMPGPSGYEFLRELRAAGEELPVIFLTARHAVDERVKGLELGADDYVIKPFEFSELLARMHAVVRRRQSLPTLEFGDLYIDLSRRIVERDGERIEVSPREFDLLRALAEARGQVLTRTELLRQVWNMEFDPGTNVVDVQVARLRRKVDRKGEPLIHTVVGEGYRFGSPAE